MELEKIVSTVLGRVGNTDVSPETVKTLIALKPVAEGAEPDDAYFEAIAKAVKSVQGNVNNVFSTKLKEQVDSKVEEYKKAHSTETEPDDTKSSDKDMPEWAKQLKADLEKERMERQKERTEHERKNLIDTVRKGLKDKFDAAGLELNQFFLNTAIRDLQIPEKDADAKMLIEQAEKLYNANRKAAGIEHDAPRGGGGGGGKEKIDEHEWDDVAKIVSRNRPQAQS